MEFEQIHAGEREDGESFYHTDYEGKYWSGDHSHRTKEELLHICQTTIRDLYRSHPELK